jgi:murein L,D-transpeptidase YcbB/YkuD
MRDHANSRTGFDRVLMAVAATFLTVSGSAAFAQGDSARNNSAAELAIDAAIPRPEPVNVRPLSLDDFKPETTASVPEPAKATEKSTESKLMDLAKPTTEASVGAVPASDIAKKDGAPAPAITTAPDTAAVSPAAAEPAKEPVKAANNVPPEDQPVADKLREMLGAKTVKAFDRKAERAAVDKFYGARDFAPVWTQGGALTASAKGVIARLKDAAADGLNVADYPVPDFAAASGADALADADLKLTASMLDYARQAQSGRMHWSQVTYDILYPEHPTDPAEVLANITTAPDANAALESYNPPHKLYRELKKKLAELRGDGDGPAIQIADGPPLKFTPARKKQAAVEMEDARVPQLRAKLGVTENADDIRYDAKVAEAVRKFQQGAELPATGVLDSRTVKAINSPKRDRSIDTVLVNMERWRWLPRQLGAAPLGNAYVMLNIPDFTLKVMQNGAQVWNTKVVVGKVGSHATPMLTETMKFITVNPTWNVPPSIIYNEYLPALQQDPTVLQRMGLRLDHNRDGSVRISQPPGEANALGRIRFNFPNKFLVYQHDTPDKHLFANEERAYSHGCMRVQNPDQYAAVLLGITNPNDRYTAEKIRGMYGRGEVDIKFPTPVPVHLTYQTAFVDDAGKLQLRKDLYGRDAVMLSVMRNKGRDLENVMARAQPGISRPSGAIPANVAYADNYGNSGNSFFERLFGVRNPPPPTQVRRPRRAVAQ